MLDTRPSVTLNATSRSDGTAAASSEALGKLRGLLLALLAIAIAGTAIELVLLEHYDTVWQWTPLALFALGFISTASAALRPGRGVLRTFQAMMSLFVAAGFLGLYLHYHGNAEFELEMVPSLHGLDLFRAAIRGATPALAPGTMVQLGLLGLACTYRHPHLRNSRGRRIQPEEES
jgi:hypothetical protein